MPSKTSRNAPIRKCPWFQETFYPHELIHLLAEPQSIRESPEFSVLSVMRHEHMAIPKPHCLNLNAIQAWGASWATGLGLGTSADLGDERDDKLARNKPR